MTVSTGSVWVVGSRDSWADLPLAAANEALPVLVEGAGQDWSRPAGDIVWSSETMLDHMVLGVCGYAGLLAARPADRHVALVSGTDRHAPIAVRIEAVGVAAMLLSWAVRGSGPDVRAYHSWGTSDPAGFAAMGGVEILVHTYDLTRTLGFDWMPPDRLCAPILDRLFPEAPPGYPPTRTLLWCTGRLELPGLPRRRRWQWDGTVR